MLRPNSRLSFWFTNILICILLVIIALSVIYFINGSVEEFPTEEQHASVRIAMSLVIFVFAVIEVILLYIRKYIKEGLNR